MRRTATIVALLLITLLIVTACGKKEPTPVTQAPNATAAPSQSATASAGGVVAPTTAPAAAANPTTAAPAPTEEEALPTGKGVLSSYVQKMEIKEEILKPEQSLKDWFSIESRISTEPAPGAYSITMIDKSGADEDNGMKMLSLGGFSYIYDPEGQKWMKFPRDEAGLGSGMSQMLITATDLTKGSGGDLFDQAHVVSRRENVDGVSTTHYRIDGDQFLKLQSGFGLNDWSIVSGQADFWIANQGNYVKKYEADFIVNDNDGKQLHEYYILTVSNENQPVEIQAPPADQVEDMSALSSMMSGIETPEIETPEGDATESDTSSESSDDEMASDKPGASELLAEIPAPPQSEQVELSELSSEMAQLVQILGAGGPNHTYLTSATIEEVQAFYKEELESRGYISFMNQMGQGNAEVNMYGSDQGMIELIMQEDAESGKLLVLVMVLQ